MMSHDKEIDVWVTDHQDELLHFLSSLVQIPSEVYPPHGNELACQKFIEAEFKKEGAVVDVFTPDEVPGLREHPAFFGTWDNMPRSFKNRPDVVGVFRGEEEEDRSCYPPMLTQSLTIRTYGKNPLRCQERSKMVDYMGAAHGIQNGESRPGYLPFVVFMN